VRIGKYAIPALLLITLAIGTVAAAAYVILTFTMTLPIAEHPRVYFWNEGTTTEANTFILSMDIFPNVTTIDENATWNIRSTGAGKIFIRVSAMDSEVDKLNITAYDGATTLFAIEWTGGTTDWGTGYDTGSGTTDFDLWIEVTGASGISSGTASVTVELKVEEP